MDETAALAFALKATAFHEAGHAVMALILDRAISKVTIAPGQSHLGVQRLGACHLQKGRPKNSQDFLEDEVMMKDTHWGGYVQCGVDSYVAIREHFFGVAE